MGRFNSERFLDSFDRGICLDTYDSVKYSQRRWKHWVNHVRCCREHKISSRFSYSRWSDVLVKNHGCSARDDASQQKRGQRFVHCYLLYSSIKYITGTAGTAGIAAGVVFAVAEAGIAVVEAGIAGAGIADDFVALVAFEVVAVWAFVVAAVLAVGVAVAAAEAAQPFEDLACQSCPLL